MKRIPIVALVFAFALACASTPEPEPAPAPAPPPPPVAKPAPPPPPPAPEPMPVAQPPRELPKTASSLPLVGLGGIFALGLGAGLRVVRRRL